MPVKKTKILAMDIDETSLVGIGDDPEARVVVSKSYDKNHRENDSRDTINNTSYGTAEDLMPDEQTQDDETVDIDFESLPKDVQDYIGFLEDNVELPEEDDIDTDDTEKELAGVGKSADDDEILKEYPEIAERLRKADERVERAEAIAKAEQRHRIRKEMIAKAEAMPFIAGTTDERADLLEKLHDFDTEIADEVESLLSKANSAISEGSLFKEFGSAASGLSDPVAAKAAELRASDPSLTEAQAITKAYEDDPSLYSDHLKGA